MAPRMDRVKEIPAESAVPSISRYNDHLDASIEWLHRSIRAKDSGSSAYYGLWGTWSRPYPETTGYIISTLLEYARHRGDSGPVQTADSLGTWLLAIQHEDGYWHGGLHPPRSRAPSVFNTAQILLGLTSLYHETGQEKWLVAASKGASWIASGIEDGAGWPSGNYVDGFTPTYYTRVVWPLLEVWAITGDAYLRERSESVLDFLLSRRNENGTFQGWGFKPSGYAFTHTVAYTLRGFLECARLLDDWKYTGAPCEAALEKLYRKAELTQGRIPGQISEDWGYDDSFSCLTGNVQLAICLLVWKDRESDPRLVNAACKLVDYVCSRQKLHHVLSGRRGAVAGSTPVRGSYMRFRYPNWAAKFHADALIRTIRSVRQLSD